MAEKSPSLATQAYETIKENIMNLTYPPGMVLTEAMLTKELGMSRSPVRTAIQMLQVEGLIVSDYYKSMTVKGITEKDINEIYQLRDSPETRPYFFQGTKELKKLGLTVRQENYEKVYSSPLTPGITLDHIFQKFNINHPEDFTGHSLSISDIVVLHENGKTGAFYVDHSGFTIIPDFLKESEQNHEIRSGLSEEQSTDLSKLPYSTKSLQKAPGAMPPIKNTIIVNLFAGPGAGKTTCAWEIASELKKRNIQAEYVPEYAKELVWDEKRELLDGSLKNQRKLFQEQNQDRKSVV